MDVQIERRGANYWARVFDDAPFFVGRTVRFGGRVGLSNIVPGAPAPKHRFKAAHYETDFGFWSRFIAPTVASEGGSFTALNSYDRARFTFGLGQFGAHVAQGDFVCLLRHMLSLPEAGRHFPALHLSGGLICRRDGPAALPLEHANSSARLAVWLNPKARAVDAIEAEVAARLIYWTERERPVRLAQIAQMVASSRRHLVQADRRLSIHGQPASVCCVLADLLHHGRGGRGLWTRAQSALRASDPLEAMLSIGAREWASRVRTLRQAIHADSGFATQRWNSARQNFDQ